MDPGANQGPPGLTELVSRLGRTLVGLLRNRWELLAVEWQIEKARQVELLKWTVTFLFCGLMGAMLLTAAVILMFPQEWRLYVTAGFALLYLLGAAAAWFVLKGLLHKKSFSESLSQLKKDTAWLDFME